ncbi:thioesterase family protein [Bremerella cremea]|uniref:acyl-CoA thioesterase n=1 Tax=Bremerella cremea TaxID=1031537 RepID=UPI0031EF0ED0
MSQTFQTTRRVEFRDTDAAGIVHFSAFLFYMEQVEHEFLRSLSLSVHHPLDEYSMSWPRVSVHCDYKGPAKFEEVLDASLAVTRLGSRSVTYRTRFHRDSVLLAEGSITAVCCQVQPGLPPKSMDIPEWFKEKLLPFVDSSAST